jgi:hypothetical protein
LIEVTAVILMGAVAAMVIVRGGQDWRKGGQAVERTGGKGWQRGPSERGGGAEELVGVN